MTDLYTFLKEVEQTHRERITIDNKEEELITPLLYDLSRMPEVYECFAALIPSYSKEPLTSIDNRRVFIFIILRLYCPRVFAGYKLSRGIRDAIANILQCEPSLVSHNFRNLSFYYLRYTEFRTKVDNVFTAIYSMISE